MAGRNPARLLAPLALVAFALSLFIVVSNATEDDAGTRDARDTAQPARATGAPREGNGTGKQRKQPRRYTIKPGDTPSGIAERLNVSLETLLELNPDLDPQSLQTGSQIKLR